MPEASQLVLNNHRYYPAVRTGSSNTHFFSVVFFFFFGGHLPQTSSFRSAKEILVVSFATQPRTFIPGEGEQRRGLMPLGLFLFLLVCAERVVTDLL